MVWNRLHVHSDYSTSDAVVKVEDLVKEAKKKKCTAIAVTEHGNLSSSYDLWKAARNEGIKPVLGTEAYFVDDLDSEGAEIAYNYAHIVLIAMNEKGWQNLKDMVAEANMRGFYYRPRVDIAMLKKYKEGIIISTACIRGLIGELYLDFNKEHAGEPQKVRNRLLIKRLKKLKAIFGDRMYFEVMLHSLEELVALNKVVIKLAKKFKTKIILTHDTHYLKKDDYTLHDAVICVNRKTKLMDPENGTYSCKEYNFGDLKQIKHNVKRMFPYITLEMVKEWMRNTVELTERVEEYEYRTQESPLPQFCKKPDKKLFNICKKNIVKKIGADKLEDPEYTSRLKEELRVIKELGFADYFLIMWDIANYCKAHRIPYNARGSVCGSLVAFLLGITIVDPVRWGTPFERFLTKDRLSLPDIDADVGKKERKQVIDYIQKKYGKDNTAHIVNFTAWKPKGAIKDAGRVLGLGFQELNSVTKHLHVADWEELENLGDEKIEELFAENEDLESIAKRMQGFYSHKGIHASGVIVTPDKMTKWVPVSALTTNKKRVATTDLHMYNLEDLDILKVDILGQTTLDVIRDTLKYKKVPWKNFDELAFHILAGKISEDQEVYDDLRKGKLTGIFQLGTSKGMGQLTEALEPYNIHDIQDIISLYRPAVLQSGTHAEFVERRFGKEYEYLHPKMGEVLDDTHGIMLYQEQCVAGGTSIMTEKGELTIKEIVEEKYKVRVLSKGENSSEWKPITQFHDNGVKEVFELVLDDGKTITCTEDHKILTDRGWVMAKHLKGDDEIITIEEINKDG